MPEVVEISDEVLEEQMLDLAHEAEQQAQQALDGPRASAKTRKAPKPAEQAEVPAPVEAQAPASSPLPSDAGGHVLATSLADMLRPLLMGLQAMGRTSGEHSQILMRLDKAAAEDNQAEKELPKVVGDLRTIIDQRNTVSRQMFDALHEELKSYKDGFLLDTVHRPMIRDLITLYDDLSVIHQQMREAVGTTVAALPNDAAGGACAERLVSISLHVEHNLDFILEVLARLDVSLIPLVPGKLDKKTQRAVAVEAAEDPDDDLAVVRTVKRGFFWKERVVRAEEVVVKKWKEGFLMALRPTEE